MLANLISDAYDLIENSSHVSINYKNTDNFNPYFQNIKPVSWDWYLKAENQTLEENFFDFVFNSALNGGYFEFKDGKIKKWEINGSGSVALGDWIKKIYKEECYPITHYTDEDLSGITAQLQGLPFYKERLAICTEFGSIERRERLNKLLLSVSTNAVLHSSFTFEEDHVEELIDIYPAGFGKDPFYKKAFLAFLEMTGYLTSIGVKVENYLPIPSDYQIPRILTYKNVIFISESFREKLNTDNLILDVESDEVRDYRAAAIVAANSIAEVYDIPDYVVDNVLFTTFRKDPGFVKFAINPMRCNSIWF